ncbi:MAG: two-component system response regulator [Betaproteobacteria bacterium]|nr:two-component system response regulator [Betaproteobacteria bacterium]
METMGHGNTHVLVVDDQPDNLLLLEDLLEGHYFVHTAHDGDEALDYLNRGQPADLILLDVVMPGLNGYEVCRRLKENPQTWDIPVIFLTSLESAADEERGLSLGAEDFIHKPFSPPVALARVRNHLKLSRATRMLRERNLDLEYIVAERTREIQAQADELVRRGQQVVASQDATIMAFCSLAEARDYETGNHIRRTQNYVRLLAQKLQGTPQYKGQLSDEIIDLLYKSAPLHDIGKVAIPDAVLLKPGKLDPEEWEVMKMHTVHGRDAIVSAEQTLGEDEGSFLRYAREIAYGHHERWDGTGYPQGLAGDTIPLSARIMAVADVYDALISRRVYKPAFSHQQAIDMIVKGRGGHFEPGLVDAFLAVADAFKAIALRFADEPDGNRQDPVLAAS